MSAPGLRLAPVACAFAALALWPLAAGDYGLDLAGRIMILALLALSLELLVGTAGLVCFGQAAFFGAGAYAAVLLSQGGTPPLPWLAAASVAVAATLALAVGALALRTRGAYFIMATLAFAQMAYHVVHDTPLGGGTDGIYLYDRPALGTWIDLDRPLALYYVAWTGLAAGFALLALLLRSNFGRALAGLRVNETRMRAAGFSPYPYQLAAFTLSGAIAGFAGFLHAVKDGFVHPELLGWKLSGTVLVMIILGGLGHLRGALAGAFAFALLQELFKSPGVFGDLARHWQLGLGLSLIACVALMPQGLVGLALGHRPRRSGWGAAAAGRIRRSAPDVTRSRQG